MTRQRNSGISGMARRREEVPHAMGMPEKTKGDLLRRLSRVRGQIDGVRRMIEEERYCPDIMQQISAAHSALRAAEKVLLGSHLDHCATHAIERGGESAVQAREELVDLFYRYMR
ncbi:MAG: metal-sensitive transcriptional regulator [Gemmatimonadales bacterium]|nr:MAG: metal-sensitive transcriptional regulator [Gemmatimonadales bacterium]